MDKLTHEDGINLAQTAIRMKLAKDSCERIDIQLKEMIQAACVVCIVSNKTREEAILSLDTLIEAVMKDFRANGQAAINDGFDSFNEKLNGIAQRSGTAATDAFNVVQAAKSQ